MCRHLGGGATALLTDTNMLTAAVASLTLLALGVYSAREGTRAAGRVFDRYIALAETAYLEGMFTTKTQLGFCS